MCSEFADDGVTNDMSSNVTECDASCVRVFVAEAMLVCIACVVESGDFGNSVGMHSGLLRV